MSEPATLCEWCASIQFDFEMIHPVQFDLGSGARVKASQCPFCRLVVQAFLEGGRDIGERLNILLEWGAVSVQRWAFRIKGHHVYIGYGRNAAHVLGAGVRIDKLHDKRLRFFIEPTTGSVLDTARILRWLSSYSPTEAYRGLHLLRLIDIEAGCLVEKRICEKYVVLSYVWGAVSNFRLTKANRGALLKPNSIREVWHRLPETIKDTIALVQRLGGRYLWVDALCLLQNDAQDLERGVNAMNLVYERAWFTIIAACGHDANARLPGVHHGTRGATNNTVEVKPGLAMGSFGSWMNCLKIPFTTLEHGRSKSWCYLGG